MTTAAASLLISGLALVVSTVAATASWRAYRLAGANVVVDLTIMEPMRVADGVTVAGSVQLSISNKGVASIGINHAIWIIELDDRKIVSIFDPVNGPDLPMTLSGLHSADWEFSFDEIFNEVGTDKARAQVTFSLGDRDISTPWRYLPGKDSVTVH